MSEQQPKRTALQALKDLRETLLLQVELSKREAKDKKYPEKMRHQEEGAARAYGVVAATIDNLLAEGFTDAQELQNLRDQHAEQRDLLDDAALIISGMTEPDARRKQYLQ